jgi:hypothetical protein
MSPPRKPVWKIGRGLEIEFGKFDPKRVQLLLRKIFAQADKKKAPQL